MKFRKATKKIVAVASATALASASVFGAANYPSNFVQDGELNAQVVVGSGEGASDMNAAQTIVADLEDRYSGDSSMTTITYREAGASGESVAIRSTGSKHTYGKNLNDVKSSAFFDTDMDILRDTTVRVGSSTNDVEHEIEMGENGIFEHALRHRLADDISSHLFIDRSEVFSYTATVEEIDTDDFEDVLGENMNFLGNEYTVVELESDEITLVGGASRISLGEGDLSTVTVNGNSHDVRVMSVSEDRVLVELNGQSRTIREYQNLEVGGVNVAVTDLISSSRDSVQGYAELVIGGDELVLADGSIVEMNGEDIDEIYEDYIVNVDFSNEGSGAFTGFTLSYNWDNNDGMILRAGDSFEDRVFNAFRIEYEGMNDVDYTETRLESAGEWVTLSGESVRGDSISEDVVYVYETEDGDYHSFVAGSDDTLPWFVEGFEFSGYEAENLDNDEWAVRDGDGNLIMVGLEGDVERLFDLGDTTVGVGDTTPINHMKADGASSGIRLLAGDEDDQYFYEMTRYRSNDDEYTFEDLLRGTTRTATGENQVNDRLNDITFGADGGNITQFTNDETESRLALANELLIDFTGSRVEEVNTNSGMISLEYDTDDINEDSNDDAGIINIGFTYDDDDNEVVLERPDFDGTFTDVASGARSDITSSNSDIRERVDEYGTKVRWDDRDGLFVEVHAPDRQVEAMVNLVAGQAGSVESVTVPTAQADDRVAELEADGATVIGTSEESNDDVEVNIDGPITDMDLTEADVAAGNHIVVGGPAVNEAARIYLGIGEYTIDQAGVEEGEFVHRYYEEANSIVVYGYSAADTTAAVQQLNAGTADFEEE